MFTPTKRPPTRRSLAQMVLTNNALAKISTEENLNERQSSDVINQDESDDMEYSRVTAFTLSFESEEEDDSKDVLEEAAEKQEDVAEEMSKEKSNEKEIEPVAEEPCVKKSLDFECPEGAGESPSKAAHSSFFTTDESVEVPTEVVEVPAQKEQALESAEYEAWNIDPAMPSSFSCEETGLREIESESEAIYEEMTEVRYYTEVNEGFEALTGMKGSCLKINIHKNKSLHFLDSDLDNTNKTSTAGADNAFLKDSSNSSSSRHSSSSPTEASNGSDSSANKAFLREASGDSKESFSNPSPETVEIEDSSEDTSHTDSSDSKQSSETSDSSNSESSKKDNEENVTDYGELNKALIVEEEKKKSDDEAPVAGCNDEEVEESTYTEDKQLPAESKEEPDNQTISSPC